MPNRMRALVGLALAVPSLLMTFWLRRSEPALAPLPEPTEHWLSDEDETSAQSERLRWLEQMHVAPPGVDWRAIERANQERELERRNRIVRERAGQSAPTLDPWEEVGSKNQAGCVVCSTLGPERNGRTWLYCGSANGGLWRRDLVGGPWEPLSDNLYGGITDVLALAPASPSAPDVLFVRKGNALYLSTDGGQSWTSPTGLESMDSLHQIALLPDAGQTLLVLGRRPGFGNYRLTLWASSDRGASFSERWSTTPSWKARLWTPRIGPEAGNVIYLLYQGKILRSPDAGFSFSEIGTVDVNASEGLICGSEAGAPTLYCAMKVAGAWQLYRSNDGGATSVHVHDFGDYWGPFAAYSNDPNAVIYGGLEGWRSLDGGASFQKINSWGAYYGSPATKLHADLRGMASFPDPRTGSTSDVCFVATDGGLYQTTDHGLSVQNLSLDGLGVGQFYSTLTSTLDSDLIVGGTQDQGYQRGLRQEYTGSGPSTPFAQLISGDYGHLTSSDGSHRLVYSTYPGFILIQDGEQSPILRSASFPTTNHLWLPPVVADPNDYQSFFFLGSELYRYTRATSSTWTFAQYSAQDFTAFGGNYLSAMAFAPSQPSRGYAMTDGGRLLRSSDHGLSWSLANDPGPGSHYFYGNALVVNPADPNEAFAGGSGYGGGGVRRTLDGGLTWQLQIAGLPSTLVFGLCFAPDGSGDVYAATEIGAYRWQRTSATWQNIMDVFAPNTAYWCVESVDATDVVRFGTYGRGIWDYLLHPPTAGRWKRYGEGLGGANFLELDSATVPNIGTQQQLAISGAAPAMPGWVLVGRTRASRPYMGGTLLVLPEPFLQGQGGRLGFGTNASGDAQVGFPIANDTGLIGRTFTYQAVARDPLQPQGLAFSNGLEMTVGY